MSPLTATLTLRMICHSVRGRERHLASRVVKNQHASVKSTIKIVFVFIKIVKFNTFTLDHELTKEVRRN